MPALRPYQAQLDAEIHQAWEAGFPNVMACLPTGGGKTVTFAHVIHNHKGYSVAIAHRQELVGQISMALAREGVEHRIIGPDNVAHALSAIQVAEFGRGYIRPKAGVAVAGVDTLIRREDPWFNQVTLWVMDEGHHLLRANKWGKAVAKFARARGLAVTATPGRSDKKGLGRHADGVIDYLVMGPTPRELIQMGYLTPYRVFAPPSDLDMSGIELAADGDYNKAKARAAVHRSHIVGDIVDTYVNKAHGKLAIAFAVDIEHGREITDKFNAAGVKAAMLTGDTPDAQRREVLRKFRNREILEVVNVDLFGEGFDLPALEVVQMGRPTASLGLFLQQFGRTLRPMDGKTHGIVFDHVGNVIKHGLPDAHREWSLDAGERRSRGPASDVLPVRPCPNCTAIYYRYQPVCPECGFYPEPRDRSRPEAVDGDLLEYSEELLRQLRGEQARIDGPVRYPAGISGPTAIHIKNTHLERQAVQAELREAIAYWGGLNKALGRSDQEGYRVFYQRFGIDVLTAQTLGGAEARKLRNLIIGDFA